MAEAHRATVPVDAYFRLDAESEERLEYWTGSVVAMAGETRNHAVVKDDVVRSIERQRPDYLAVTAGLRVLAPGYGRQNYAYPDGILILLHQDLEATLTSAAFGLDVLLRDIYRRARTA